MRRATQSGNLLDRFSEFQSTLSVRRATQFIFYLNRTMRISIHALREESDNYNAQIEQYRKISIHALREESDPDGAERVGGDSISIHALREESDRGA